MNESAVSSENRAVSRESTYADEFSKYKTDQIVDQQNKFQSTTPNLSLQDDTRYYTKPMENEKSSEEINMIEEYVPKYPEILSRGIKL